MRPLRSRIANEIISQGDFSMTYWQIGALLNALMALIIGLFVLVEQRHRPEGRAFVILNLAVFVWAGGYFFWQSSKDAALALFWCGTLNIGAAFIAPAYFHSVVHLLRRWDKMKHWVIVSYSIGIFQSLFMHSPLVQGEPQTILSFPFWPKAGPLYILLPLNSCYLGQNKK